MKSNYIDVIVFVILVSELLIGMKAGLILIAFDLLSLVFGWIIAKSYSSYVATFIASHSGMNSALSRWISGIVSLPTEAKDLVATPENLLKTVETLHLPSFLKDFVLNTSITSGATIQDILLGRITSWVIAALGFVVLFLLVVVVIRVIGFIIRRIVKVSPFLKWVDIVFGGILKVFLTVVVLAVVLHAVVYVFTFFNAQQGTFVSTVLSSRFYSLGERILPLIFAAVNKIISGVF